MAIQGQCIGTAVEPLEYDFNLSTYDCSILSTSPYTDHRWCVEMPGCTWISGDTAYTPPGIGNNSGLLGSQLNNGSYDNHEYGTAGQYSKNRARSRNYSREKNPGTLDCTSSLTGSPSCGGMYGACPSGYDCIHTGNVFQHSNFLSTYQCCRSAGGSLYGGNTGGNGNQIAGYCPECPGYASCRDSGGQMTCATCDCTHMANNPNSTRSTRNGGKPLPRRGGASKSRRFNRPTQGAHPGTGNNQILVWNKGDYWYCEDKPVGKTHQTRRASSGGGFRKNPPRINRNTRNRGGTHGHNYNTGPGSGQTDPWYDGGNAGHTDHASIGQHSHRIYTNSVPPHNHPIYQNEGGHFSSRMKVEDVWEGGPPLYVNAAITQHGYDPSLEHGDHNHFMNQQSPLRGSKGFIKPIGGHTVNYWTLDCGNSSANFSCDEAASGGWVDGEQVGETGCVSHNIDCHEVT